jgi:hypothetical protein
MYFRVSLNGTIREVRGEGAHQQPERPQSGASRDVTVDHRRVLEKNSLCGAAAATGGAGLCGLIRILSPNNAWVPELRARLVENQSCRPANSFIPCVAVADRDRRKSALRI